MNKRNNRRSYRLFDAVDRELARAGLLLHVYVHPAIGTLRYCYLASEVNARECSPEANALVGHVVDRVARASGTSSDAWLLGLLSTFESDPCQLFEVEGEALRVVRPPDVVLLGMFMMELSSDADVVDAIVAIGQWMQIASLEDVRWPDGFFSNFPVDSAVLKQVNRRLAMPSN